MCYHKQSPEASKLDRDIKQGYAKSDFPSKRLNGFDHPEVLVVLDREPDILTPAQWGLLPFFAGDKKEFWKKSNTLNCMIETAEEKASFKRYVDNRCLIPVSAFYEWKHEGKDKIPHKIWVPGKEVFNLAGLWSEYKDKLTGETTITYTVLTTTANTLMADIHNSKKRMPVVLLPQEEQLWLQREKLEPYHERKEVELQAMPI